MQIFKHFEGVGKPSRLHVIHGGGGGANKTFWDLWLVEIFCRASWV